MSHATVRATNIPEIVKLICENMHMSESEALDAFYSSSTGKSYANDETGLYGQSVLYVYGLFCTEMRNQKSTYVSDVCPKISENKSINMCLSNENVSKRTPKK